MKLLFDAGSCIRATSKFSTCTKCVDICPVETIELVENIPAFTPSACITCGGCVGVCPTESFSLSDFSTTHFFFEFLDMQKHQLLCKDKISCLSTLSVEHLLALALANEKQLVVNLEGCHCGGEDQRLRDQIRANIEEVNFLLESISSKQIAIEQFDPLLMDKEPERVIDRRDFLSLKTALKGKGSFDEAVEADELKSFALDSDAIDRIRDKNIPDKRKLLFSVLKRLERPKLYDVLATEDISFISQKFVEEHCTNCQICYRICPTGALSSDSKSSVINFDAMICLKCHLCHDVCEPNAIHLQAGFELKELFEPTQRTLAKFTIKRCQSCGNYFTYRGGEEECTRCKIEEEEAMMLHQNAQKMDF
jgi:ferredoxin